MESGIDNVYEAVSRIDMSDTNDNSNCSDGNGEELESNGRQLSDSHFIHSSRKQSESAVVDNLIDDCVQRVSVDLDLARKALQNLPNALLQLTHLEYLYLEGNELEALPDDFFSYFPNLKWLDLRRNRLVTIPSIYLRSHRHLQTLLLEGNKLCSLPLELGLVRTLDGLNIRNNCLEFPPPEIIEKGTRKILSFLRRVLRAKTKAAMQDIKGESEIAADKLQEESADIPSESECSSSDEEQLQSYNGSRKSTATHRNRHSNSTSATSVAGDHGSKSMTSTSLRCLSVGSSAHSMKKRYQSQSDKYLKSTDEPVTEAKVREKFLEEKSQARIRRTKIKQDEIIQKWKDKEIVKEWREETKDLQMKKMNEKRINGFIDYVEPAKTAPFGISGDDMKMITNSERLAQRVKKKKEKHARPLSPATLLRIQQIRDEKERLLREKVRLHTEYMRARRARPAGDPHEDMNAAQRELEIAQQLHREVQIRRKELEYRFTAHAVDAIDGVGSRDRYS